jgi:hypothetical protein
MFPSTTAQLRQLLAEIEQEEREEWALAMLRTCHCYHCRRTLADLHSDSEERWDRAWLHLQYCDWACCETVAPALPRRRVA